MPPCFRARCAATCTLFALGFLPAFASAEDAYITNFNANSLSVIDTTTNVVTATIPVGPFPQGIAVTPDGTKVVFANRGPFEPMAAPSTGSIAILDRATNTVTATIPDAFGPVGIAITPDGTKAYVANGDDPDEPENLWVIDIATGSVVDKINVGAPIFGIVITPDGSSVYVGNGNDENNSVSTVTVVATATNAVSARILVGQVTAGISIAPDGTQVYVANSVSGTVSVIDTATATVSQTITVPGEPWSAQPTPDGKSIWVLNAVGNTVSVIATQSGTITRTIQTGKGPQGIAFTSDGATAYVTNFDDGTVSVIDTATGAVTSTIPVGAGPTSFGNFIAPALAAPPPASLAAAILPDGRSVEMPAAATVFATMLNLTPMALDNCQLQLPSTAPAGLTLHYQTTDPETNAPTGSPNTPTNLAPNGLQTFVLAFTADSAVTLADQALTYQCDGVAEAPSIRGVNTIDLLFSNTPIPDIIALSATTGPPGTVTVPFSTNGAAAFSVATSNAGAAGSLTVSVDTGAASLPISAMICETDPNTGACLVPPARTVTASFMANGTSTFSVFVSASAAVPFAPGTARLFIRFEDAGGVSHGSTSVAVQTD